MIKILHLRSSDIFSSPERLIIGQCKILSDFDFVCASFVRKNRSNRFIKECRGIGFVVEEIIESFPGDLRVLGQIRQIIKKHQIDIIITHDYKANIYSYLAARNLNVFHLPYFHGYTAESRRMKLYNFIDKIVLRKLEKVIAVSERSKYLLESLGVDKSKITVVPNAIDKSTISSFPVEAKEENEIINIIAAGRFSFEKGFDHLLDAISEIKKQAPRFKLHLYGKGPEETNLREKAILLELTDQIDFCGFVDDILPIFAKMDMLVLSSRSEGMPVIILEAWSQAVGVLATAVGGVPELITSDKYGIVVEPENIKQLADKLLWALNNINKVKECGNNGRELLQKEYIYEVQAEKLRKIYSTITDRCNS